jgi:glycosyltransferase involved in cell wall biosynthesis
MQALWLLHGSQDQAQDFQVSYRQMVNRIFLSIASYRDPDLINTVRSAFDNATYPDSLIFSVFSQAEESEHPDLSFVTNLRYQKAHWSESLGACWARERANRNLEGDYFLQIDSHSRFLPGWDKLLIQAYKRAQTFWGNRIFFTNYPDPFELDSAGEPQLFAQAAFFKLNAYWHEPSNMVQGEWADVVDTANGDEQYFMSANSMFAEVKLMQEIPYDAELYFTGEEPSLALRAYTRGIRLISPTIKFMFTNYNRPNSKRRLHWEDHPQWHELNRKSYDRLKLIMSGDTTLGKYGVGSKFLFKQYQRVTGIDLAQKSQTIR